MNYYTIPPSPELAAYIRYFWVLESGQPYTHYSMADVCPELIFHYRGQFDELLSPDKKEKSFTSGIHAQSSKTRIFTISRGFGIFGAYLYPQTVELLSGISAAEITNEMADLKTLLKSEGLQLEEQIFNATNHQERIKITEAFILQKLSKKPQETLPVFHSIQEIIRKNGLISVKQLASENFSSTRQFERQFRRFSGFSPKLFARIARFQHAMAHYGKDEKKLTDIAYRCGYYDQSHFINDFKEFSGLRPKDFFSGNSDASAWRD